MLVQVEIGRFSKLFAVQCKIFFVVVSIDFTSSKTFEQFSGANCRFYILLVLISVCCCYLWIIYDSLCRGVCNVYEIYAAARLLRDAKLRLSSTVVCQCYEETRLVVWLGLWLDKSQPGKMMCLTISKTPMQDSAVNRLLTTTDQKVGKFFTG